MAAAIMAMVVLTGTAAATTNIITESQIKEHSGAWLSSAARRYGRCEITTGRWARPQDGARRVLVDSLVSWVLLGLLGLLGRRVRRAPWARLVRLVPRVILELWVLPVLLAPSPAPADLRSVLR